MINNKETKTGWISVKDERPPQHVRVIGWHPKRQTCLLVLKWCTARRGPKFTWENYEIDGTNRMDADEITHWQYLPKPPSA